MLLSTSSLIPTIASRNQLQFIFLFNLLAFDFTLFLWNKRSILKMNENYNHQAKELCIDEWGHSLNIALVKDFLCFTWFGNGSPCFEFPFIHEMNESSPSQLIYVCYDAEFVLWVGALVLSLCSTTMCELLSTVVVYWMAKMIYFQHRRINHSV